MIQIPRGKKNPRYIHIIYVQEISPIPPPYEMRPGVLSGAKFPGKHAHTIYVHVTCPGGFIIRYAQKTYVREICPKNICPGNISKLYMSERHATFDNAGDECSRTIPAQNVRRHNARNICQK